MPLDWQRLALEVERIHTRYQIEVVEAFGFCPWAKAARCEGRVTMFVTFMREPDPQATLELMDRVLRDSATEVGMLIFPALTLSRLAFTRFVAAVRNADEARCERGEQAFALAEFHPSAELSVRTPEALVPYLRRSPDPMIQIVRTRVLAEVRGNGSQGTSYMDAAQIAAFAAGQLPEVTPPLAARLAEHNARTLQRVGVAQLDGVLRAIQADRKNSYAALGFESPTHAYMEDM